MDGAPTVICSASPELHAAWAVHRKCVRATW
jgi:hypothetical protein